MPDSSGPDQLLDRLDLSEYEAIALRELFAIGRTTAPELSAAADIPKARIYDVIEDLSDRGFVKVIPGRPKEIQPKDPKTILDRAVENRRQSFEAERAAIESMKESFLETFQPQYEQASQETTPTEELFWVVDVGEVSERETRRLYAEAQERVRIFTKSFEYFPAIEDALRDAISHGIDVEVLFVHEDHIRPDNRSVQRDRMTMLQDLDGVAARISESKLPVRGTLVDPSMEYETGEAIFLVEEDAVPLHLRQAAVTENEPFVAGMNRLFELIWEYESIETY